VHDEYPARAVVFDLDGVLVDTEAVNIGAARAGFAAVGFPLTHADEAAIVGRHPDDYVPILAERHGVPEELLPRLREVQNAAYQRDHALVEPIPGSPETVHTLADRGWRLAVATSSGRGNALEILERIGLLQRLEFVLSKDDVARRKPAPDVYLRALERFALTPPDLLVVEDSPHGVAAAKSAGLRCIARQASYVDADAVAQADRRIADLRELLDLLRTPA
jgi:HAD superfamily hydrolase (TIGR01509 family)